MTPTPRAKVLVESAREVLMQLNQKVMAEESFDPSSAATTFTFALSEVGELLVFPKICKEVRRLAPEARLRSLCPMQDELMHGMASGEIDVAVGKFVELERSGYYRHRLRQSDVLCLMRADHPIDGQSLSLQEYHKMRHLEVGAGGRVGRHWDRLFHDINAKRKISIATTFVIGLPEIIEAHDVVATVTRGQARYFCRINKHLKMVEAPFLKRKAEVNLYWHRKLQNQPKNRWIRALIKNAFSEDPELGDMLASVTTPSKDKSTS